MSRSAEHILHQEEKTMFGFWIYLMTDGVLFATLFASYAVLRNNSAGGPGGSELFNLSFILASTIILLVSSFTCGLAYLFARRGMAKQAVMLFCLTFVLGLTFLGMELYEFNKLISEGNSWRESAFLSAFFTLVGTHGLHIASGLLWMAVMIWQIIKQGLNPNVLRRLGLLTLFWHFLDVIWIFIFSFVYLLGAL